ncbi:hypothetical protein L6452_35764 [Arctium lappa]|uniref:Uncharacterized protein n=1 Tax=Arctium lappa TaxID=4217 RepID=A0ACB8Y7Y7_ARCLA|nr:hypothetical protein L6452_35764 [Arctium lappa]
MVSGCDELVVTIHSTCEETNEFDGPDDRVCLTMHALFKVHGRVVADDLTAEEDFEEIPQDNHLPACALSSDELVHRTVKYAISGESSIVRKSLFQIATRLHDNPSRSQHLLASSTPNAYPSGGSIMGATVGAPIMGLTPLVGAYGGSKGEGGEWPRGFYPGPRDDAHQMNFLFV